MKVLHAIHTFPGESYGGTETYLLALARGQARRGMEPVILAGSGEVGERPGLGREEVSGVRVLRYRHPPGTHPSLEGADPAAARFLGEILAEERPSLLHVHHWFQLTSDLVRVARERGIPAVVTIHDFFPTCPLFFRLPDDRNFCPPETEPGVCAECLGRFARVKEEDVCSRHEAFRAELEAASALLAISRRERELLARFPFFRGISFLPAPLPFPGGPWKRGREGKRAGGKTRIPPLRLVTWGGLVRGKGLGTLFEACRRVRPRGSVAVHHYGRILDPEFQEELTALAQGFEARFMGTFREEDGAARFGGYDLAVFPSFFEETHGFVVDEALALGLPVAVSDRGAPPERVGTMGVVFPAGDADTLARILQGFLEDPGALEALRRGRRGPQPTLEEHMDFLEGVYAEAQGEE